MFPLQQQVMVDPALQQMQHQMQVMQHRQAHMVRVLNWVVRQQATGGDENEEEEEEEEEGSEEESSSEEESPPPFMAGALPQGGRGGPRRREKPPGHMPRPGQPFLNIHLHNQCA